MTKWFRALSDRFYEYRRARRYERMMMRQFRRREHER
jgi:hypothetical protein